MGPYWLRAGLDRIVHAGFYALCLLQESLKLETNEIVKNDISTYMGNFPKDQREIIPLKYTEHKNAEWLCQVQPIITSALRFGSTGLQLFQEFNTSLVLELGNLTPRTRFPSFTFDLMNGGPDQLKQTKVKVGLVQFNAPTTFAGLDVRVEAALNRLGASKVDLVLAELSSFKNGAPSSNTDPRKLIYNYFVGPLM
jgi:hypothetical protein